MDNVETFCEELTKILQSAYEEGVTIEQAERLAARFLQAQMVIANELAAQELDARMRKTGVKALRGAVYMKIATAADRKPSDSMIEAQVNSDKLVQGEQEQFDIAEVSAERLSNYLQVFRDGHIYMRGVAKGRFE